MRKVVFFLLLLGGSLEGSWEKAIVEYNLGTVKLREGKLQEAMIAFIQASGEGDLFPPMEKNLYQNLALARLVYASEQLPDFSRYHLKKGFEEIRRAGSIQCSIEQSMGREVCVESERLNKIEVLIVKSLNKLSGETPIQSFPENPQGALTLAIMSLMEGYPQKALKEGREFLRRVERSQREERGCHQSPWKSVLPLFTRGFEVLEEGNQELAVIKWEQALHLLQESPPQPETYDEQTAHQGLLYTLQQMETLDHIRTIPRASSPQSSLNPW